MVVLIHGYKGHVLLVSLGLPQVAQRAPGVTKVKLIQRCSDYPLSDPCYPIGQRIESDPCYPIGEKDRTDPCCSMTHALGSFVVRD